jgi:hypothetical protein
VQEKTSTIIKIDSELSFINFIISSPNLLIKELSSISSLCEYEYKNLYFLLTSLYQHF